MSDPDDAHDAHDVYHVAFLLRQVIVPDLIPTILDLAEYWPKITHSRQDEQSCYEHTAGVPYLDAPVGTMIGPRMVRKVVFSVTSHDQGWCSDPGQGSWTWMVAEVQLTEDQERPDFIQKELYRNDIAQRNYKTYVVTWRYDAEDEEESSLVRSLDSGSRISVVPWARFRGWGNHVSVATMDIYASVVTKL
jgi:hypothetical protein